MRYELIDSALHFDKSVMQIVMNNRGIEDTEAFLNTGEWNIESPYNYNNIRWGAETLINHVKRGSSILIVVDCDMDGYASGAYTYRYIDTMCGALVQLGHKVETNANSCLHIITQPNKEHGLNDNIMSYIREHHYDLIILPDSSSNDFNQHEEIKTLYKDTDILVLDHHNTTHFSAHAIVVNNQLSEEVENKAMTGVGVVYKLAKVVDEILNIDYADSFLDLVAVGMVGDSCDIRYLEANHLIQQGLKQINEGRSSTDFFNSIIEIQGRLEPGKVTMHGVAFYIAPLVNAVVRTGNEEQKVKLFRALIDDHTLFPTKVGRKKTDIEDRPLTFHAVKMCKDIKTQQDKEVEIGVSFLQSQIEEYNLDENAIITLNANGQLNRNYTGLIAGKFASKYQRPCLVLNPRVIVETNESGEVIKEYVESFGGSARGFDKGKAFPNFQEWVNNTGLFTFAQGHANSFGLGIKADKMDAFMSLVQQLEVEEVGEPVEKVDYIFNENNLNKSVVETIGALKNIWSGAVFEPQFAIEKITVSGKDLNIIGKNSNTLKFTYKGIDFIKFFLSQADKEKLFIAKDTGDGKVVYTGVDKVFTLSAIVKFDINEYNGNTTPQIQISNFEVEEKKIFSFI